MAEIAVIAPVLRRPQNAAPLAESLAASTERARLVFVCSLADESGQFEAAAATGAEVLSVEWQPGPGDYARKIQAGYDYTSEPLVLLAADDLRFHPGWLEEVERIAERFDCGVVGTNDMANGEVIAGRHSTHPVVRRCYIDQLGGVMGEPGRVLYAGYDHNYCDVELVATARARGCYAHAHEARVEHLHPLWGTAPRDATYQKGARQARRDMRLFEQRRRLWERAGALA